MSRTTINGTRIEPLSKDNYDTWKMQIEALMIKSDLWEYVNGENTLPAVGTSAAMSSVNIAAQSQWRKNDRKARSDLILSIHPSQLPQVRNLDTSREVWLKLESIYASKGPARKAMLLKQLILQRMVDGADVREHMAKFFDAVDKLTAMEVEINSELLSIMLLYSLPSSFDNFRVAIESRDELPTVDALKVKILEEYNVRKQTTVIETAGALAATQSGRRRSRRKKNKTEDKLLYLTTHEE
ncbi:retrovirus-related pol polyprotein from transposon tnt 1-94 [Lasius niger]|uniref:Retrovirus-related pol polyprotein from transposon tnt 1-94 n=1 Tax=Lasius niger TaxID=67767 RepID=A0A0J7KML6_LASNI|nr:retrovirus-related pol polyprotein from transposon tnt 1-94 [Lasius niger]